LLKILYTIAWPLGQGGHINSLLILIQDIIALGFNPKNIYLIAPKGGKLNYFLDLDINYIEIKKPSNNLISLFSFSSKILYYSFFLKINIIHCLDYNSLKPSILSSLFSFKKIVFTKAGGTPIKTVLPSFQSFIVFSVELLNFYNNESLSKSKIHLIFERIKIDKSQKYIKDKLGNEFKIFIAMRMDIQKSVLLDNLFSELGLYKLERKLKIIIAGGGQLLEKYKLIAHDLEEKKSSINFKFLGEITDMKIIKHYNLNSNLIVGHGRGILESMVIGKPVVLLGYDTKGSQLITSSNIKNISDYNFSGRNLVYNKFDKTLSEILNSDNLGDLLKQCGDFNKSIISEKYDSIIGAKKTIEVYRNTPLYSVKDFFYNILWLIKKI
jgi:hypothetical protein